MTAASEADGAALLIQDLVVRYGALAAVNHVSLSVAPGSLVGLIGPNGAGKTTFVDAVTGLTPSTGAIWFEGRRIDELPAYRRSRLGLVRTFQSLELFEELTVAENLTAAAEPARWHAPLTDLVRPRPSGEARERVAEALHTVGLGGVRDLLVSELSLGQRKLVTVARALAMRPKLALLDEPAAGLDSDETAEFGTMLRAAVAAGTTVLMIDHDMGFVLGVCDTVHVLEFGRLLASGSPSEIRSDQRVIDAYLGGEVAA